MKGKEGNTRERTISASDTTQIRTENDSNRDGRQGMMIKGWNLKCPQVISMHVKGSESYASLLFPISMHWSGQKHSLCSGVEPMRAGSPPPHILGMQSLWRSLCTCLLFHVNWTTHGISSHIEYIECMREIHSLPSSNKAMTVWIRSIIPSWGLCVLFARFQFMRMLIWKSSQSLHMYRRPYAYEASMV